mgnify:CR=1 FL=1
MSNKISQFKECFKNENKTKACMKLLRFPKEKQQYNFPANFEYLGYFVKLFPKRLMITNPIHVNPKTLQFQVSDNLLSQLNSRKAYTITPIIIRKRNIYGLLQDRRAKIWTMFVLPGSKLEKNDFNISKKLLQLLEDKFELEIRVFYTNIRYLPPVGSVHYPWWSSYLIFHALKKVGTEREQLVNQALKELLTNAKIYTNFVQGFRQYIQKYIKTK